MVSVTDSRNQTKTLTFDCYGTLIDWAGGLTGSFVEIFGPHAPSRHREVFDAYVAIEAEIEGGSYRSYRDVLNEIVPRLAHRLGWPLPADNKRRLPDLLPTWTPFPDTNEALQRLKKKFRLGVLSNIDRDLFAGTAKQFSVSFDFVITAQDVGSYKPARGHFLQMLKEHGPKDSVLHVAQSQFHDGGPANALGIAFAWVNRYNDPVDPNVATVGTYPDLKSLADDLLTKCP